MQFDLNKIRHDGEYMLLTTNEWFIAKDGQSYRAVWGKCRIVEAKDVFGFKPTHGTNWYMAVGESENAMFIAGCQIHYAQLCLEPPVGTSILRVK